MYGHGFATLFLGEMYGMTGDEAIKEKLQRAVQLIEQTQNPEGGWRYQPAPLDADISVTICQVMALRAAREAGIKVDKDVIDKAIKYVRRCQNSGWRLQLHGRPGRGSAASASRARPPACCALYYAGIFEGDELKRACEYVKRFTPGQGGNHRQRRPLSSTATITPPRRCSWPAANTGPTFYPAIREELIRSQEDAITGRAISAKTTPRRWR